MSDNDNQTNSNPWCRMVDVLGGDEYNLETLDIRGLDYLKGEDCPMIIKPTAIPDVELKQLQSHSDDRGFFREVIRKSDGFFREGFAQWSHSQKEEGHHEQLFHIHKYQVDWWYVPVGLLRVILFDTRGIDNDFHEFMLGDGQPPQVLRIPPGVAHNYEVLVGPASLMYITSKEYDPDDEGRIDLGFEWDVSDTVVS